MKTANLLVAVVVAAVGTGLYLSRKPWTEYSEQRKLARQAETEMSQAESERAEYVKQTARAETFTGREAIARERGYRRPNESSVEELK